MLPSYVFVQRIVALFSISDFSGPIIVLNGSSYAILRQKDDYGEEHIIMLSAYSRNLLPRRERYSTVEKELQAIKQATMPD